MIFKFLLLVTLLTSVVECSVLLNCEFGFFGSRYSCTLKNVVINNENEEISIRGVHLNATLTDDSVRRVWFQSSSLSHIPLEILRTFKNLEVLQVRNSGLKKLNQLTDCGNLRDIWAWGNEITQVTRESLAACTNLRVISLHTNPIVRVEDGFFNKSMANLWIHLHNCSINEIETTFLDGVQDLSWLSLQNNTCIDRDFYDTNPTTIPIIRPAFQKCFENFGFPPTTTTVATTTERTTPAITVPPTIPPSETLFVKCLLYMASGGVYTCKIQNAQVNNVNIRLHIGRIHLPGLNDGNVESVEFEGSSLLQIPIEFFSTFRNLKHLNVSYTRLQTVNKLFSCGNLENLYATNNEIRELRQGSLASCPKLKVIEMSHNPIRRLENRFFRKATRGMDIRLDNCEINEVEPTFFFGDINISVLNLLNNKCVNFTFNNINPSNAAGIRPFFLSCFENFENSFSRMLVKQGNGKSSPPDPRPH